MYNKIFQLLLFLVIVAIFYFSWLSDPGLSNETYLPKWLLKWSNHYYNLRTAVPFVALGFLLENCIGNLSSNQFSHNKKTIFMLNIGIATLIVCIAELGQFLVDKRSPDVKDVFYGIIGSLVGALVNNLFKKLRNAK